MGWILITKLFRGLGMIWLANSTTSLFTRSEQQSAEYSAAELHSIAHLSAEEGSIDSRQRNVIQHILELRVDSM